MIKSLLEYGMNNYKQEGAATGAELMISNYDPPLPVSHQKQQVTLTLKMDVV